MDAPSNNLRTVRPADIDPRFNRGRHLPALGTIAVHRDRNLFCPATDRYSASDSDYFEQVQRKRNYYPAYFAKIERMMAPPRELHYWARLATYPERP